MYVKVLSAHIYNRCNLMLYIQGSLNLISIKCNIKKIMFCCVVSVYYLYYGMNCLIMAEQINTVYSIAISVK